MLTTPISLLASRPGLGFRARGVQHGSGAVLCGCGSATERRARAGGPAAAEAAWGQQHWEPFLPPRAGCSSRPQQVHLASWRLRSRWGHTPPSRALSVTPAATAGLGPCASAAPHAAAHAQCCTLPGVKVRRPRAAALVARSAKRSEIDLSDEYTAVESMASQVGLPGWRGAQGAMLPTGRHLDATRSVPFGCNRPFRRTICCSTTTTSTRRATPAWLTSCRQVVFVCGVAVSLRPWPAVQECNLRTAGYLQSACHQS